MPACARNEVLPSSLPSSLWEQITLPLAHGSRDLLFCPSYVIPVLARCPTLLAHHGSYEGYPQVHEVFSRWALLKTRLSYPLSARRATVVTTVSAYSRQDMVRYYGMSPERIHVVPEGVDTRRFKPIDDAALLSRWRREVLGDDVPFVLYVGKPTRRRNLPNLLAAFARMKSSGHPHKLLLIGTALPGVSFDSVIDELRLREHVVTLGHADHQEIALAYNASDVFVYPSSYEGFGMPVLEAMACGTPVIALNNTAFPEFAGGVADLLPDASAETLERGLTDLLADEERRKRMRIEGPRRAAAYDWRIVTRRYLDLMLPLTESVRNVA
jgi:glycosyltransferase involved in cell wall biosynthesis